MNETSWWQRDEWRERRDIDGGVTVIYSDEWTWHKSSLSRKKTLSYRILCIYPVNSLAWRFTTPRSNYNSIAARARSPFWTVERHLKLSFTLDILRTTRFYPISLFLSSALYGLIVTSCPREKPSRSVASEGINVGRKRGVYARNEHPRRHCVEVTYR